MCELRGERILLFPRGFSPAPPLNLSSARGPDKGPMHLWDEAEKPQEAHAADVMSRQERKHKHVPGSETACTRWKSSSLTNDGVGTSGVQKKLAPGQGTSE